MATIKNTISMQDKMTPVMRSIIKAMQSTITAMAGVDQISDKVFDSMKRDIKAASEALDEFGRDVNQLPPAAADAVNAFGKLRNPLMTAASAIYTIKSALQGVSQITNTADEFVLTTARLNLMNDGLQTTSQLQNMILASAQRARVEYGASADAVSKLGILAADAFSSTEEIVAFSELMNKSFKVGGAGIQEQTSAMYQLTQAMAAGKLQGDEFRSIMENAPMLAAAIADFTGKSKGELKEMSSEGLITADIIKGAMFAAADDINDKFATMPKTFGDTWTSVKNMSLKAFQPVIEKLNQIANAPGFEVFLNNLNNGLIAASYGMIEFIDLTQTAVSMISQNWSLISDSIVGAIAGISTAYIGSRTAAILYAIAQGQVNTQLLILQSRLIGVGLLMAGAVFLWNHFGMAGKTLAIILGVISGALLACTVAQYALNKALWTNPIVWVIALIVALIGIIGLVTWYILKLWKTNMDFKYGILKIWNDILGFFDQVPIFFQGVANGIADAFGWAKVQVLQIMQSMANGAIDIINKLISAVNKIPGVAVAPIQQLTGAATLAAQEQTAKQSRARNLQGAKNQAAMQSAQRDAKLQADRAAQENTIARQNEAREIGKQLNGLNTGLDAYLNSVPEEFDWNKYMSAASNPTIAGGDLDSVGKIKDDVSITDEDIKLLKDVAAVEFVNKYTTLRPEMTVSFGDVRETADVNKIHAVIEDMVEEAYASSLVGEGA